MKFLRGGVILAGFGLLFFAGLFAVDGISRGSKAWIGATLFILCWLFRAYELKQAELLLRIRRLEDELGKHQRWHGHMTEFKE